MFPPGAATAGLLEATVSCVALGYGEMPHKNRSYDGPYVENEEISPPVIEGRLKDRPCWGKATVMFVPAANWRTRYSPSADCINAVVKLPVSMGVKPSPLLRNVFELESILQS